MIIFHCFCCFWASLGLIPWAIALIFRTYLNRYPRKRPIAIQLKNYAEQVLSDPINLLEKILPKERRWYHFF